MVDREALDVADINAAIRSGGEQYWRRLYAAWFGPLTGFIGREFGPLPADICEELSYRTLLKLVECRRRPQFGHQRQFVAWLYKAARCTALDYWKSLEGRDRRDTHGLGDAEEFLVSLPQRCEDESAADLLVQRVLAAMSERERLLLTMRASGTAYAVIAAELRLEENAARTYFDRAKKKFARLYTQQLEVQDAR
jgi:RNA polymerase sigma factor (sigma-70 family)